MLIANSIGALWTAVKSTDISQVSVVSSWLGILAFTFQIYFDFSGYSDMAIGLGKMMGFHFPENFNYPYLSKAFLNSGADGISHSVRGLNHTSTSLSAATAKVCREL